MAGSGFASKFNFRKQMSERAKKSKYETIVRTAAEIEEEEEAKKAAALEVVEQPMDEEVDAEDD